MIKMLIVADDFTGALDTGVKFSAAGAATKVVMDTETDFAAGIPEEVLVLCAPTRHLPPQEAYRVIRRITERASAAGIGCIFKKTDSALRGNIGAELSAVLDGSGESSISFIPALPSMNRVTRKGVHYIDGVPVDQSVFGQDPVDPVMESYVPDLLRQQCSVPVRVVSGQEAGPLPPEEEHCIRVFDCSSQADMESTVQALARQGRLKVVAGCAGLAESLPPFLGLRRREGNRAEAGCGRLAVICGSVNPISCGQMDCAEAQGWQRLHIPLPVLLQEEDLLSGGGRAVMDRVWSAYLDTEHLIIDSLQNGTGHLTEGAAGLTLENIRQRIARRMGAILKALIDREDGETDARFMIIGGDTLLAFLEAIRCRELTPIGELCPGVVLSKVTYQGRQYEILSKSGGFGQRDLLLALQEGAVEYSTCALS